MDLIGSFTVRRRLKNFHQYFTPSLEIKEFDGRWERKMSWSLNSVRSQHHLHLTSKTVQAHYHSTTELLTGKSKGLKIMNLKIDTSSTAFQSLYLLFCNVWPKIHPLTWLKRTARKRKRSKDCWSGQAIQRLVIQSRGVDQPYVFTHGNLPHSSLV